MRPLHSKHLHSNISFFTGEANFCRINRLIQESLTKHRDKQISPTGKADIGQSSRNKILQDASANSKRFGLRVQICLIKAQIAGNNRAIAEICSTEEADLGLKMIVYGSAEVPLTNRLVHQILISKSCYLFGFCGGNYCAAVS